MKKEALVLCNVIKDLESVAYDHISNVGDWRFTWIIPNTILAILIGIIFNKIWVGALIFLPAVYHIVYYIIEYKAYKSEIKAIKSVISRGDVSISVERLSHAAQETVYEPRPGARRARSTKEVSFLHFHSGASWRVPIGTLYGWSPDYYISPEGLCNVSVDGDEFFYVTLQGYYNISYVYPCKFFALGEELAKKQ